MALEGVRVGDFVGISSGRLGRLLNSDFLRHGILVFAGTMTTNVLSYAFNFIFSRHLGVENYATLAALIGGFMLFSIPSTAINLIAVKYAAEYHAVGDAARLRRLSTKTLMLTSLLALAIFVAGALLQPQIAAFLHIANDAAITWTLAIIALGIVMPSARGIVQGCQDFRQFSISLVLEAFLKLLVAVALVYAGFGVAGAMAGWAIGTALALLYTLWAVRAHFGTQKRYVRLSLEFGPLLSTVGMITVATALLTFLSFIDVVLVKHYFSAHEAGLYSAANLTGKIVLFLVGFLPTVLLPKVVKKAKNGESSLPLLLQAAGVCAVISGVVLLGFSSKPQLIVTTLAGRAFVDAAPLVFQYDVAMVLLAMLTLVVNFRIAVHRLEFVPPLAAVLVLEVVGVAFRHASLWDVVHVLLIGNTAALLATCYRIESPERKVAMRVHA